jgi:hypothetical protein
MQTRVSGFLSKFFFEILPATLASAVAGFLFAHFGMPPFQQAAQQAAAVSPVSEEMLKMVHDDHEAFVDYLKKAAEKQEAPGAAAQQAGARLKQEEQNAAAAIRQAKEAEAKALAAARAAERKVAARTSPQARIAAPTSLAPPEAPLGQLVVNRPVTMAPAQQQPLGAAPPPLPTTVIATPAPRVAAPAPPPATTADASESRWSVGGALHRATSSVTGLFTADPPPRPPGTLPQQNFSNASDVIGSDH